MEVAIRTSTIIAALLSAIVKAKLVFFNNQNMDIPTIPQNIEEVSVCSVTYTKYLLIFRDIYHWELLSDPINQNFISNSFKVLLLLV